MFVYGHLGRHLGGRNTEAALAHANAKFIVVQTAVEAVGAQSA